MERMSASGTWSHEDFDEYAEHSLTHDDVPEATVSQFAAEDAAAA